MNPRRATQLTLSRGVWCHTRWDERNQMDFSSYEQLLFERRPGGVTLITLNRPEK